MAEMLRVYAVRPITGEWKDSKRTTRRRKGQTNCVQPGGEDDAASVLWEEPNNNRARRIHRCYRGRCFRVHWQWTPTFGQHLRQRRIRLEKLRERATRATSTRRN